MLDSVQHTSKTSVEEVYEGLSSSLFHEPVFTGAWSSLGVTQRERELKPSVSTALARLVKGLALALAVIAGVSAAPRPVAAAETPAEIYRRRRHGCARGNEFVQTFGGSEGGLFSFWS